ncbi:hypothetical protein BpJC7_22420 [Weizmannia acidilactici]|uniref:DUF2653 family protein n=1 Tax=Weizmannia acidilactici TaxID=2607726 RepID=A0A5J4JI27_9BACI|nr:DUF2653 family protein [Weizmannia acidilactici]GER68096.1 hypothetical protein BpJC4_25670 [Weizmannia acidilactici]GER70939.1 hypothetical protein BpJC7_22420 [Weizmannia acidilactici]GER73946.1 hypothetical protein BpPP18_20130 [Weizmannia acidilactici]
MEELKLTEQELINAVCSYVADQHYAYPENVMAVLTYDDGIGYGADVELNGRDLEPLTEPKLIQAIRKYLEEQYSIDPFAVSIRLEIEDVEGMVAYVD